MIFLQTDRLILRNVERKDAEVICDYRSSDICARYQVWTIKDLKGICELIERRKDDVISTAAPAMVAVALKDSGEMIGEIAIMPNEGAITLGYTLSYRYHRKGYAYEALSALINMLHAKFPDWEFISFVFPENEASKSLLLKLGYKNLGYIPSKKSVAFGKWTKAETDEEFLRAAKH